MNSSNNIFKSLAVIPLSTGAGALLGYLISIGGILDEEPALRQTSLIGVMGILGLLVGQVGMHCCVCMPRRGLHDEIANQRPQQVAPLMNEVKVEEHQMREHEAQNNRLSAPVNAGVIENKADNSSARHGVGFFQFNQAGESKTSESQGQYDGYQIMPHG